MDPTSDFARHVHVPWGFLPSGRDKVRAACSCGYLTTARVNADRALAALVSEHGYTEPICATCGKNHAYGRAYESPASRWANLRDNEIEILSDGTGGTFLVCRDMPGSCRMASTKHPATTDQNLTPLMESPHRAPKQHLVIDVASTDQPSPDSP
ncbi:hypothetical protein ACWIGI_41595 [Nocardia sp. NPDC055321]